jgi:hypothetical protein
VIALEIGYDRVGKGTKQEEKHVPVRVGEIDHHFSMHVTLKERGNN